jgi:hypothetical protein
MRWRKALILYTDLQLSFENHELCWEILDAGKRVLEATGNRGSRVLLVGDELA